MDQERAIREEIRSLIMGDVSLSAFERSIGSKSWSMFNDGSSPEAIHLIAAANLLISELHDRIVNEREFRHELSSLLNNVVIEVNDAPLVVRKRSAISFPMWVALPSPARFNKKVANVVYVGANASPALVLPLRA
jgi:hypothetical protein